MKDLKALATDADAARLFKGLKVSRPKDLVKMFTTDLSDPELRKVILTGFVGRFSGGSVYHGEDGKP